MRVQAVGQDSVARVSEEEQQEDEDEEGGELAKCAKLTHIFLGHIYWAILG